MPRVLTVSCLVSRRGPLWCYCGQRGLCPCLILSPPARFLMGPNVLIGTDKKKKYSNSNIWWSWAQIKWFIFRAWTSRLCKMICRLLLTSHLCDRNQTASFHLVQTNHISLRRQQSCGWTVTQCLKSTRWRLNRTDFLLFILLFFFFNLKDRWFCTMTAAPSVTA